jgi:hypothetical protein
MFGTRIQCTTVLTALLITLNAMIPISTLQYLETSPLSPHSTPEHDFIGQHAKTLQAGGQEDQPRSSARTVKSSSNFSLQAETLPFFSVSVSDSASSVGLSQLTLTLTTWHARQARVVEEGTKDRECGSPTDYDIERLVSRWNGGFRCAQPSKSLTPCLLFVCCLLFTSEQASLPRGRRKHKVTR